MPPGPVRGKVVARIVDHLVSRPCSHPLRVAVDGPTAAGKSTLARELVAALTRLGRPAVHLSTKDFHHRAEHRRRDPDRARGYYRDAFDLGAFRTLVLDPLGPGGDRRYVARLHDLSTDGLVDEEPVTAQVDAVVVVDGSFLQCTGLRGAWDEVLWLDTSYARAVDRAVPRDASLFGSEPAVREAYATRYHAAGRLYEQEVRPREKATIVLDNETLDSPLLRRIGGGAGTTARLFSYGTLQQVEVQLAAADTYEVDAYRRDLARLASSELTWVYLGRDAGERRQT